MRISPSALGNRSVGETNFTLTCSADIVLRSDSPHPTFEWFFGPTNTTVHNSSNMSTVTNSTRNTYTSTLHFVQLQESHAGLYTCRLGGNQRLATATTITFNGESMAEFKWSADMHVPSIAGVRQQASYRGPLPNIDHQFPPLPAQILGPTYHHSKIN